MRELNMYEKRIRELRKYMNENELTAIVVVDPNNQYYLSGFKALIYSRPIYFVVTESETAYIVPSLEETHASEKADVNHVLSYYEHPEKAHLGIDAQELLLHYLRKKLQGEHQPTIGIEYNLASIQLYQRIQEAGYSLADTSSNLASLRSIKDRQEIEAIKESSRLVSLAVQKSLAQAKEGVTELEIDQYGNHAVFQEVSRTHPSATIDLTVMSPSGKARSVMPHVFSNTRKLQKGDVVIHSRQVGLNGYRSECERTFFIGEPSSEEKKVFQLAVDAQQAALNVIKAGVSMKEIDLVARKVIEEGGYEEHAIHRVGHSIGLSAHETPYIRFDAEEPLQAGMVLCIEPGIYVKGLGGFRHSDTVLVTDKGVEVLTDYPRDLEASIL